MASIVRFVRLAEAEQKGSPFWIATVIAVEGSTPVETGMKMAVFADGASEGTIGGGEIEKRVIERIHRERPKGLHRWRYDLGAPEPMGEKTGMLCGGMQEILVESYFNGIPLYIFGGGHCGIALSSLAAVNGFAVTVLDDRDEWASLDRHSSAVQVVKTPFQNVASHVQFSEDCFLVIMTHGHRYDEIVLRQCLDKPFRYLGMLGSGRKVGELLKRLREDGVDPKTLERLHAPVGLEIGSHTPEEIAVSIVAEMIAVKYGKDHHRQ